MPYRRNSEKTESLLIIIAAIAVLAGPTMMMVALVARLH